MLHFGMNMPFILMMFYGSVMILIVLLFRILLKKRLPKFVFPVLWCVVLVRLLVPFSLSSPLSIKASETSFLSPALETINTLIDELTITEAFAYEDTLTEYALAVTTIEDFKYDAPHMTTASGTAAETTDISNIYAEALGSSSAMRHFSLQIIYFVGLILTIGILLFQKYRYSLQLKNRLLIEHNETINSLLREMEMGQILIFSNDEIASPLTCGLLRPDIYLPTHMDFQNRELLHHILLHETMHIKRRDNWVKAFMLIALCLNWFNPLVWLMAKCLARDLESACDEAVLKRCNGEDERKNYAFSLLAMAITGSRTTLLYSAFSKTEVEKRIQSILHYKKTSVVLLAAAVLFMSCSTIAFATCVQAPFSPYLTSTCASASSRWGVKVYTTRDLTLGKNAQKRAEDIVFDVLRTDTDNDPILMDQQLRTALADEFHVEKSAFGTNFFLCLSVEDLAEEYAAWELVRDESGFYMYKGEFVRIFTDETAGSHYSLSKGVVDVTIIRDRFGYITDIRTQRAGDDDYDLHTEQFERNRTYSSVSEQSTVENTAAKYAR